MGGFEAPSGSEFWLDFESEEGEPPNPLQGLQVKARAGSTNEVNRISELAMDAALTEFAEKYLIEWDLVKRKKPVPATAEGLLSQEVWFGRAILKGWFRANYRVSGPLDASSRGGET